jgi:hypothetical protein
MNLARSWAGRSIPVLLASLTLVACTNVARPAPPTAAEIVALAPDGQRYAAIVAPIDDAVARFESMSGALPTGASVDDFVVIARALAGAVAAVDDKLRQATWPPSAIHDIKAELAAGESLRADINGTLDVTLILDMWRHQIIAAADKMNRIRRTVRIDLGLVRP